jgi:ABC-type lipoprotein export system ATPase subunit
MELLDPVVAEGTVIMITHDSSVAKMADDLVRLG